MAIDFDKLRQLRGADLAWGVMDAIEEQPERLNMLHWHCGTAHCFMGWAQAILRRQESNADDEWYFWGPVPTPATDFGLHEALGIDDINDFMKIASPTGRDGQECGIDELRERITDFYGPRPVKGGA